MKEFYSASEAETEEIGRTIALGLKDGDFVAMYGEMGSGKTVFMRGFVHALIPEALVSSPTYAILNVYENAEGRRVNHFDMYRITSSDDLYSTGFDEVISQGITVCEWAENIPEDLPYPHYQITFYKLSPDERRLVFEKVEK